MLTDQRVQTLNEKALGVGGASNRAPRNGMRTSRLPEPRWQKVNAEKSLTPSTCDAENTMGMLEDVPLETLGQHAATYGKGTWGGRPLGEKRKDGPKSFGFNTHQRS